jgi:sulfur carrier protein ThiS
MKIVKKIVYQNIEEKTDSENLEEFLSGKNLLGKRLIIEINNIILQRDLEFRNIKINNNDIINIFLVVSGG